MEPLLRFPEFNDTWRQTTLNQLLQFKNGINAAKEQYGHGRKFINVLDILNNDYIVYDLINSSVNVSFVQEKASKVEYGDLLFLRSSETREDVGKCNVYLDIKEYALFGGFVIRGKKSGEYDPYFLKLLLNASSARNQISSKSGGSTRYNVSQEILESVLLNMPRLKEQQKISSFFKLLDQKIGKQKEKIVQLELFKKGILRKIFTQEIRFKDENGQEYPKWKKRPLSKLVERITRKNKNMESILPLTISAQHGLVDQITFFNKTVAGTNLEGYYLLYNGEFAYNKSYSNGYPFGAIKRLHNHDKGVLSSLYICFKPLDSVFGDYLEHYFESTLWYKEMSMISVEGARNHGLLNIGVNDFFETMHMVPDFKEQQKIALYLSSINSKIEKESEKLISLTELKKGLMQQMFI
ncbi:type I restriction enzyme, S subunit [Paenibacillus sp. 1_12]|uniref:restriction endonuclease subunit S n=1 Tax=Paenibacillus sp. 1_12 TaxID=1566278 RepID=UPI0008E44C5A|nr:restriction endonuclease subunit S [Paenibacillus sp. 1_12]SFM52907.1 type I restriction enzyme, S subunit [Paenibacillus sp. 1_12]